jgi:outer membrane receptor protein involved in Fe transport
MDLDIPQSTWSMYGSISVEKSEIHIHGIGDSTLKLAAALIGNGGAGGNEYFNPFYTNSPDLLNSSSIVNYVRDGSGADATNKASLGLLDFVATGDVIDLPSGALTAPVGIQYRDLDVKFTPAEIIQSGDLWGGTVVQPVRLETSTNAAFMELAIPVLDSLEVQVAVRAESPEDGPDSTNPKLGLLFKPFEKLSIRASWGTSFVVPNSNQLA